MASVEKELTKMKNKHLELISNLSETQAELLGVQTDLVDHKHFNETLQRCNDLLKRCLVQDILLDDICSRIPHQQLTGL